MNLEFKSLELSEHAFRRSKERFNLKDNKKHVLNYWKGILKNATEIGETVSKNGNRALLYGHNHLAIYISLDRKTIVTVNKFDTVKSSAVKDILKDIHEKELKKLRRKETFLMKRNHLRKLELSKELIELDIRVFKTRHKSVKNFCENKKLEIQSQIDETDRELKDVQDSIRQTSNSMVAVI